MTTLDQLNRYAASDLPAFVAALQGIYEHSPWIPERAAQQAPFASLTALKQGMHSVVMAATPAEQLMLIRAHPELAGKAANGNALTLESREEQASAGLDQCSPEECIRLQQLNRDYLAKFGFPFILAVKGATGQGLARAQIIAALARRLHHRAADEVHEALRQIDRIAELRLNDLLS